MTNKQDVRLQQSQPAPAPEGISVNLLLRSWNKTLEGVDECKRINKESGVEHPEQFIQFDDEIPMKIKKYNNWIDACLNKRNNSLYTLESLISSGTISETELRFYPQQKYPYRELMSLSRVQDAQKSEWLVRGEYWFGLDAIGSIRSLYVDTLDYYKQITPAFSFESLNPERRGSEQVRIAKVGRAVPWYEGQRKTYITPFTLENVNAAMRDAQKPTTDKSISDTRLYLVKEGITNCISAPDLNTFVSANFEEFWEQQMTPLPTIKVDSRALLSHIRSAEKDQYQ